MIDYIASNIIVGDLKKILRDGLTWKEGPGCHPGFAKRAVAGLMEAGSVVVATNSVTIFLVVKT